MAEGFVVVDARTGEILRGSKTGTSPEMMAAQSLAPHEIIFEGYWPDDRYQYDPETNDMVPREAPEVQVHQVKQEAARRINDAWPIWRQLNALRDGETAAMGAEIDAIRDASNKLEAMTPIPADFAEEKWWPQPGASA